MRSFLCGSLLTLMVVTIVGVADTTKSALQRDPKGWVDLMPGKGLRGWKRVPIAPDTRPGAKNPWSVAGDVLRCDGVDVKEMLLHDREIDDGIYHVEWRFRKVEGKKDYNSGVYVRTSGDGKVWHQAQVSHAEKPPLMGDLFGVTKAEGKTEPFLVRGEGAGKVKPPGEWNTYEITMKGPVVSVWINGATTCTWKKCAVAKGHVGLQAEFFYIEFRKLKFKPASER